MRHIIRELRIAAVIGLLLIGAGRIRNAAAAALEDSVVFNDPNSADPADPGNRAAIQTHVIQLIDGTPAGATIRISTYIFASVTYRDAVGSIGQHGPRRAEQHRL